MKPKEKQIFRRMARTIMMELGIDPDGQMSRDQQSKFNVALGRFLMNNPNWAKEWRR